MGRQRKRANSLHRARAPAAAASISEEEGVDKPVSKPLNKPKSVSQKSGTSKSSKRSDYFRKNKKES